MSRIGGRLLFGIEKILTVGVAGVDRDAGLAEGAFRGRPVGDVVFHEVEILGDAEGLSVDVAPVDKGGCRDNRAACTLHGGCGLTDGEAGVDDVINDQNPFAGDELVVAAMQGELAVQLGRAWGGMLGKHGGQTEFEGRPLGDDQSAGRRPAEDLGLEMANRSGEKLRESADAVRVDEDGVLVNPAAAVVAGNVHEVIVGQQCAGIDKNLAGFGGGVVVGEGH